MRAWANLAEVASWRVLASWRASSARSRAWTLTKFFVCSWRWRARSASAVASAALAAAWSAAAARTCCSRSRTSSSKSVCPARTASPASLRRRVMRPLTWNASGDSTRARTVPDKPSVVAVSSLTATVLTGGGAVVAGDSGTSLQAARNGRHRANNSDETRMTGGFPDLLYGNVQ
ncbi:hypothetical protein OF001_U30227 [Pseudomonas sp. OF001]|nr:hypothetical protein OF001_U30227 [Pseudomonas sp. OF001]